MMQDMARPLDVRIAAVRYAGAIKTLEKVLGLDYGPAAIAAHRQKIRLRLEASLLEGAGVADLTEYWRKTQSRTGKLIALVESDDPRHLERLLGRYRAAQARLADHERRICVGDIIPVRDPAELSPWDRSWELTETAAGTAMLMASVRRGRADAMVVVARKLLTLSYPAHEPFVARAVDLLYAAARKGSSGAEAVLLELAPSQRRAEAALTRIRDYRAAKLLADFRAEHDA